MRQHTPIGPVLVTGAGGFIGGHLMHHLRRDVACAAIPATRDGRDGSRPVDLEDGGSIRTGLAGIKAVVHCAVGNRAVTVGGTAALLRAAAAAGVRRFVHLSSVAVYGDAGGAVTEDAPILSGGRGYGAWKAAAERACLAQDGMEVVRLRPAIVYGPGSPVWVGKLADRIRSGRWGDMGSAGEGTCNPVHVLDVAEAVRCALTRTDVAGAAFNLSGNEPMSWNAWFARLGEALALPRLPPLGPGVMWARAIGSLPVKAAARLRPGLAKAWLLGAPALSEMALFGRKVTYPCGAARLRLGWEPQIGVAEGLAGCARFLRQP